LNYRHHFHAGNFADVLKHALLLPLLRGLQRKEKGFLHLDTHAGRARYDLAAAERGDSLARKPEWPDGIGRLWVRNDLPGGLADYVEQVRAFDERQHTPGDRSSGPRFYPGSPWLAQALARPQDRLAFCELHPEEFSVLRSELDFEARARIQALDGYTAIRALLPPPEKRALVLIDPPFEEANEHARIIEGLGAGLKRLPGATFAIWYPLTERAKADAFLRDLVELEPPPAWTAELTIAGPQAAVKMKGCGLAVVNPPWQVDREVEAMLPFLARALEQSPGGSAGLRWLVPER
jgi:23S rRNA (adenine2030-N6)-methyltransferase